MKSSLIPSRPHFKFSKLVSRVFKFSATMAHFSADALDLGTDGGLQSVRGISAHETASGIETVPETLSVISGSDAAIKSSDTISPECPQPLPAEEDCRDIKADVIFSRPQILPTVPESSSNIESKPKRVSVDKETVLLLHRGYDKKMDVCDTLQGTLMLATSQSNRATVAIKRTSLALHREGICMEDGTKIIVCKFVLLILCQIT